MDYGTFGLWGGLLAGGEILAPTGYTRLVMVGKTMMGVMNGRMIIIVVSGLRGRPRILSGGKVLAWKNSP